MTTPTRPSEGAGWLERRRANGWLDDEPDWVCMHGTNISVAGDCDACRASLADLILRSRRDRGVSSEELAREYRRGYEAGWRSKNYRARVR